MQHPPTSRLELAVFVFLCLILMSCAATSQQNNTEEIPITSRARLNTFYTQLDIRLLDPGFPGKSDLKLPTESAISGRESGPTKPSPHMSLFNLLGGFSVPTGDFASRVGQSAGYAGPGFGLSAEYMLFMATNVHWLISTSFSYNGMNEKALLEALGSPSGLTVETGSYLTLCPTSGFGFLTTSDDVSLYGSAQIGLLFGRTPEIRVTYNGTTVIQAPSSSRSIAGVFSVGIITSRNFVVMLRYVTGKPEYEVTGSGGGTSFTNKFEQGTSMLLVLLGVGF